MTGGDPSDMAREDRKELTLEVLAETGAALPLRVITRNIKLRGGRFEESSVRRYLNELHDEGKVVKIDPEALDDRELVAVTLDQQGYWITSQLYRERSKSDA